MGSDAALAGCRSALPNPVAEALELGGDARGVIALDLDLAVSGRTAGTASFFQRRRQIRQRVSRQLESVCDRHALPRATLAVDDHTNSLFRRILIRLRVDRSLLSKSLRGFGIAGPDEAGFHR